VVFAIVPAGAPAPLGEPVISPARRERGTSTWVAPPASAARIGIAALKPASSSRRPPSATGGPARSGSVDVARSARRSVATSGESDSYRRSTRPSTSTTGRRTSARRRRLSEASHTPSVQVRIPAAARPLASHSAFRAPAEEP
jgi:hypothetical protein